MKTFLIASAIALSVAGQSLAADLPQSPPRAPAVYMPPPVVYNWSGFYVGVNGGYGFAHGDATYTASSALTTSSAIGNGDLDGGIFGGQAGFNWQAGALVVGVEGDFQWTWQNADVTQTSCGSFCTVNSSHDLNWFGTARGRIGAAVDRVLLYATGGAAWLNVKSELNATSAGATSSIISSSSTLVGWTAGAGIEVALLDNISAKLEYLYISASDFSASGPIPTGLGGPGTLTESASIKSNVIRGGLNFRFPVR